MKRSPKINNSMKHSPRVIMKKKGMQLSHLPKLFSLGTTDLLYTYVNPSNLSSHHDDVD